MIVTEHLGKSFGDKIVLEGINLRVAKQEIVVIVGPSGSGKSTLLRCLNGLETISAGRLTVDGITISADMPPKERKRRVAEIRKKMGMVFQNFNLFPHKTVLENIIEAPLIVKRLPKPEAVAIAEELLQKVGLLDKRDEYPSRLSGGQQQRVAIARALAMQPDIMLFDEPTSALDPELVGEVLEVIRHLASEGMTMVIVTHEMGFARDVADRIVFMSDGKIVEESDPEQFFTAPQSERARKFLRQLSHGAENHPWRE
ncbi:MAG: polar amino acid ABC transporter ATP-binding protein [Bacillaceae bacterium G1]|nr:polar amino acid ABC transporter ATP-binding protein [Bacillota bacterium]OJF18290.1 MAG: polar amino acid ABC transporter ATP-binding protein [Bacillaceae bacterium G1]